jgi:hypothetical protein
MLAATCLEADSSFGPSVPPGCRSGFDFTLYFEQAILSIVPAVLFLLITAVRLVQLFRANIVTVPSSIHEVKLVSHILHNIVSMDSIDLTCCILGRIICACSPPSSASCSLVSPGESP